MSIDVVGLYSNIPHKEAIKQVTEALDSRKDKSVPTSFLTTLMMFILSFNVFRFDSKLFIQLIGIAMGTRSAPTIANIFMAFIDKMVMGCGKDWIALFKRYIDDILIFWTGTREEFEEFMVKINKLHPTIKFTSSYNFENKSTTFLDTEISIINGKIVTDLYRKKTDKIQYLLPTSCHPTHIFNNIPYSLGLRLVRICSLPELLVQRMSELRTMLLSRKYNKNVLSHSLILFSLT